MTAIGAKAKDWYLLPNVNGTGTVDRPPMNLAEVLAAQGHLNGALGFEWSIWNAVRDRINAT